MKKTKRRESNTCFPVPQKLILIMKLTLIMSFVLSANIFASVYSQNARFSLDVNNQPVRNVLKTIEEQSHFRFFYNDDFIDLDKTVTFTSEDASIDAILAMILNNEVVSYRIMENDFIVLTPGTKYQQQRVTGTVRDASTGESLIGVTIQVKGTMTGSISQTDGSYSVNVPEGATTLIFSFVGYQTQEISVNGRTVINVALEEEITALDEVVVTGYSVERKKDIIGSVSVVNTDEMLTTPTSDVGTQLQGRVAGLTVSASGEVGESAKIRIRGFGSFGNSEPLYIIDGVPGDMDRLNPNDIESVQVLKDAASASVYGARAASGVIIITTKKGTPGATRISLDSYYGINYVSKNNFPDLLDAQEYGEWFWKSMEGAGREYGDANWYHSVYGSGLNPVIPEYLVAGSLPGAELEALRISDPVAFAAAVNPENYDF